MPTRKGISHPTQGIYPTLLTTRVIRKVPSPADSARVQFWFRALARRSPTSNPTAIQPNSTARPRAREASRPMGIRMMVIETITMSSGATIAVRQPNPPAATGCAMIARAVRSACLERNRAARIARAARPRDFATTLPADQNRLPKGAIPRCRLGTNTLFGTLNWKGLLDPMTTSPSTRARSERCSEAARVVTLPRTWASSCRKTEPPMVLTLPVTSPSMVRLPPRSRISPCTSELFSRLADPPSTTRFPFSVSPAGNV